MNAKIAKSEIELTILMPCLNEAETIACCINKAKEFLQQEQIPGEILIADNGSQDGSQQIAIDNGARVIQVPLRGYGAALMQGIKNALGRYIIMGDADDSYDFSQLTSFLAKLREGYDLVMGNRFKGKIEKGAMPFLNKYLGNPVLSLLGRVFFRTQIGDFHCGLRGFSREAILDLNLQSSGMEFASEMVVKATLRKLNMTEVATSLSPDGRSRPPHLRPWRDGWRHLRLLLAYSPRWLFYYPGLFFMILGIILMMLLVQGPVKIDKYIFDIHTMLFSSLFIIVGLQAMFFFVFARWLATFSIQEFQEREWKIANFIKIFSLEKGLFLGIILILLGMGGSTYSFLFWMQQHYGQLLPSQVMRILIPSFTCLIVGVQVIFSSFFFSTLQLYRGF